MDETTEAANLFWARQHDLSLDTPGKKWFFAEAMHPAIFRALQIDREESGAVYAAIPFRLYRDEQGARILIAMPCPPMFGPAGDDWLSIEYVLEWWPQHNRITVMGEVPSRDMLIGRLDPVTCQIFADPFAFARQLAEARAQWFVSWCVNIGDWRRKPEEPDLTPGLLLLGSADKVRWPSRAMPEDVVCIGADPQAVNRAMLRQANIPRARGSRQFEKKAA